MPRSRPRYVAMDRAVDLLEFWIELVGISLTAVRRSFRVNRDNVLFLLRLPLPPLGRDRLRRLIRQDFNEPRFEHLRLAEAFLDLLGARLSVYKGLTGDLCMDVVIPIAEDVGGRLQAVRRLLARMNQSDTVEFSAEAYRNRSVRAALLSMAS